MKSDETRPEPSGTQLGVNVTVSVLAPIARFDTNCASSGCPGLLAAAATAGEALAIVRAKEALPSRVVRETELPPCGARGDSHDHDYNPALTQLAVRAMRARGNVHTSHRAL